MPEPAIFEFDAAATQSVDQRDVMAGDQAGYAELIEAPEHAHHFE
jgi:hypothetical protein